MTEDKFYELDSVGKILGVTSDTVARWVKNGLIPAIKLPGKILISDDSLDTFLARRTVANANHE